MPIDIIKENANRFFMKQLELLDKSEEMDPQIFLSDWHENQEKILASLVQAVRSAAEQYQKEKEHGNVSGLRHIYVSWMRTGLRTRSDLYRIDLYDEQELASFVECTAPWTPPFAFDRLQMIKEKLHSAFERQSAAKLYVLDELIYQLAEIFNMAVLRLLYQLIPPMLDQVFPDEKLSLQVHAGEFLDHSELLYERTT